MAPHTVCVLIVEDDAPISQALTRWVSCRPGFSNGGAVRSLMAVPRAIEERHPDVVLVDSRQSSGPTLRMLSDLTAKEHSPQYVVLGGDPGPEEVFEALAAGARGYALKDENPCELARVIAEAADGHVSLSREALAVLGGRG